MGLVEDSPAMHMDRPRPMVRMLAIAEETLWRSIAWFELPVATMVQMNCPSAPFSDRNAAMGSQTPLLRGGDMHYSARQSQTDMFAHMDCRQRSSQIPESEN